MAEYVTNFVAWGLLAGSVSVVATLACQARTAPDSPPDFVELGGAFAGGFIAGGFVGVAFANSLVAAGIVGLDASMANLATALASTGTGLADGVIMCAFGYLTKTHPPSWAPGPFGTYDLAKLFKMFK